MKHLRNFLIIASAALVLFSGCKKDPVPDDENELITTVALTFSKAGEADVTFKWRDLSGTVSIDTIFLKSGEVYELNTSFLDESKTPVEDITEEIKEEDDEHQIFYLASPAGIITLDYQDADKNSLPVGLKMRATAGTTATGTLRVVLKHAPESKDGNFATGSTDVDVTFPVVLLP